MTAGAAVPNSIPNGGVLRGEGKKEYAYVFKMPLHYPRYSKSDYNKMPEWQLDRLLTEYGLPVVGDVHHKRNFAMGAFLWPTHN
ncbi:hypothetical protein AAHA92_00665 [Salvia divinorum]|uniref:DUF7722 domain-containing protein n=1 Tax=Salvia divinorum TaxID=28513 RepID=A0ABD1INI5_SALDI